MFDKTVESPELEDAIETLIDPEVKEVLKAHRKAKQIVSQYIESTNLQDGERLRCGPYVMEGKQRNGGGIEVPPWEKIVQGRITTL